MTTKLQKLKWDLYRYKEKQLLKLGLETGYINLYDEDLIAKLRNIYYGGIPASILLLCDGMSNGQCYDRATLMARAFFNEDDDVRLIYATVDSLRLNPEYIDSDDPLYADHCIVERITPNGQHIIYDTSSGLAYDKDLYWLMEHPKVRQIKDKKSIMEFVKKDEEKHPENIERDKYFAPLILPLIEMSYERPAEIYSIAGIDLLQREIEHFKKVINYDVICEEINEDLKRTGVRK